MKEPNSKMDFFLFRIFFLIIFIKYINCDIFVYPQYLNQIIDEFRDQPARFGGQLPSNGYRYLAVEGSPANACKDMNPPPADLNNTDGLKLVVLVARYNCTFEEKIRNAQMAGYDAVIVYNVDSNELEQMSAKNEEGLVIPSVFVGETTAKIILNTYLYNQRFILLINDDLPFNINTHLILPFSIVVGLCFVIMIGFMVVRCVREQRRLRRHRLPKSSLKKIPTVKFNSKGHAYDTCAICLEDYIDGDKLRVLPCAHAYHCKCIDPWLTKSRRVCPICKRRVFVRDRRRRGQQPHQHNRRSSDDSLTESEPDDTTPLINPVENTNHGTFRQISPSEADEPSAQASQSQQPLEQQQQQPDRRYQRFNPFDRSSSSTLTLNNNPSNGDGNSLESDSINVWQRFKRYFRRRSLPNDLNQQYDDQADQASSSINAMSNVVTMSTGATAMMTPTSSSYAVDLQNRSSSSNNVLNANLSGSFKDSDDEILDDNDTGRKTIYEPSSHGTTSSHPAIVAIDNETTSNVVGHLGVAAIPNTYFNAAPPSRRNDYNSNVHNQNNTNTNNSNNNNNNNNNSNDNNHDIDFIV